MSGTQSSLSGTGSNQSLNAVVADYGVESTELVAMGEKTKKKNDVTGKSKRPLREPAPIKEGLTTAAHCCVLAFVSLVLYLAFKQPLDFFAWHPILLSLGWMVLMSEAILAVSKENLLMKKFKVTHDSRITLHWVLFAIAGVLIATGFLIITINKNNLNKSHYTSWHGLLGLFGVITYIPPCINGVLLYYNKELKQYVNKRIIKLIHVLTGSLCFACGGMSLILSVYTKWFARRTDSNQYVFLFGLITAIFPIVWITQRPLIKCVTNIYNLIAGED